MTAAPSPATVLKARLKQLEQTERLPPAELARNQFGELRTLARHAAKHSPNFRARLKVAGLSPDDLASAEGLRRLPVLTRRDIQVAGADLFCAELPPGHAPLSEHRTSGSTGEPVVVRRTALNRVDWMALTMRDHLWQGRDFSGGLAVIRGNTAKYAERSTWGPPASLLFATGRSVAIPIRLDAQQQFELLHAFGPGNLLVYPNVLDALARHAAENGLSLPTLTHIRTISETLSPRIRAEAAAVFGAGVSDCYSSEEVGYIAIECSTGGTYHTTEPVMVEILDAQGAPCAPGEVGRVVITDVHNFATPLIRYDIGDYAQASVPCVCGRGLPALARILGRERNFILMPDGSRHWPLIGTREMIKFIPINQCQYIQHDREHIEVRLVTARPLTADEERAVAKVVDKSLGHSFRLEFVYFEGRLPMGANGKFEEFVCKAKAD